MNSKPGFFPMFMDIRNKKIVFVGGGKIATRRIKVLMDFDADITVVSPTISDELEEMVDEQGLRYIPESVDDIETTTLIEDELSEADIVFLCTDNQQLNHALYIACKKQGKLVNNCSNHQECDFYFPGIVKQENVVVGVNAGGKAHGQAKYIREKLQEMLAELVK